MFELGNALSTNYSAHVILQRGYDGIRIEDSTKTVASGGSPDNDSAATVIRQLLRGDIAGSQQTSRNASQAISMLQVFDGALSEVTAHLAQMAELATKASAGAYSNTSQLHAMQLEFEQLAGQINNTAEYTEFNGRKLLATDNKAMEVFLGYESTIEIDGSDLSLDISGLGLTTDPATASTSVRAAVNQANSYAAYVSSQISRLETVAATLDFDIANRMGYEANIFGADLAEQIAAQIVGEFVTKGVIVVQTQANANAEEVLQILKGLGDTGE